VVLDVPLRTRRREVDLDRLESAGTEFHERVRQHFLDLAAQDPSRYLVLAGRDDRDTIEARSASGHKPSARARMTCLGGSDLGHG